MIANSRFAAILQVCLLVFPWPLRRHLLRWVFGYDISASARIGFSVVLSKRLVMGPYAIIGHLTYIKGLTTLELGNNALIGNLNWITGNADTENGFLPTNPIGDAN